MAGKLIFLSHIHEESELAKSFKGALEDEFGGFVDVFVSSDGKSIPAGSNFLKKIESGLINCIGAVYLISPKSVKRNWVNFELGAVWIRNAMSLAAGNQEIPAIPICHSGVTPESLPSPINNLNAVIANQSSQLEGAFRSLQASVGGRGKLRTDFDELATQVSAFELRYTLGSNYIKVFEAVRMGITQRMHFINWCISNKNMDDAKIPFNFLPRDTIKILINLQDNELKGHFFIRTSSYRIVTNEAGMEDGSSGEMTFKISSILKVKDQIME